MSFPPNGFQKAHVPFVDPTDAGSAIRFRACSGRDGGGNNPLQPDRLVPAQHVDLFANEITTLAAPVQYLLLRDPAILVRNSDRSYTFDRQLFPAAGNVLDGGTFPMNFPASDCDDV